MTNPFFEATQNITARTGDLFNFVWPAAAALWNLRWQVQGFVAAVGRDDQTELHDRFVKGSGITSTDLRTPLLNRSWQEQQDEFAKFLVFELCSLYEAWLEDVVPRVVSTGVYEIQKALQFPTTYGPQLKGLMLAISQVNSNQSHLIVSEFFPSLISDPKNSWSHIESLLVAYRYFKECRNSFIHKGGFADQKAVDAYNAMTGIPHTTLGLEKPLNVPRLELGKRIRLDLQDAVGFSNIVHRIIRTLDAALAVSDLAEFDIVRRVRVKYRGKRTIGQQPAKRQRRLLAMMRGAGLPRPVATTLLEQLLIHHNLIA